MDMQKLVEAKSTRKQTRKLDAAFTILALTAKPLIVRNAAGILTTQN
jgi:hypothetical protein